MSDITERRIKNLAAVNERWEHQLGWAELCHDVDDSVESKWVLVEQSTHDGRTYNLSTHRSPAAAEQYWREQEHPEFWNPLCVVNLDTLEIMAGAITSRVDFYENSGEIIPLNLKKYRVGHVLTIYAENEEHAAEQFRDASSETADITFIDEVDE